MLTLGEPRAAIRFLTRIPIPGPETTSDQMHNLAPWFPLVGLLIGGACVAVDLATQLLTREISSALIVLTAVSTSGALHLDAVMDAADGLETSDGSERLERMRASTHSGLGLLVGFTVMLVAWLSLNALLDADRLPVLLLAPVIGRATIIGLYRFAPIHPSAGSITRELKQSAGSPVTLISIAITALASELMLGPTLFGIIAFTCASLILMMRSLARTNHGFTGDHYGAIGPLSETLVLVIGAPIFAWTRFFS